MRSLTPDIRLARRYSDTPRRPLQFRRLRLRLRLRLGRNSPRARVRRRAPGWAIDQRLRARAQLHPLPRAF